MFEAGGATASTGHGALLTTLNQALGAFWSALGEIGARSQVTTFTMSDFGRTLTGNGSGSDHAWGGNLLVVGDAVRGNRCTAPIRSWWSTATTLPRAISASRAASTFPPPRSTRWQPRWRWMGVTDSAALGDLPAARQFLDAGSRVHDCVDAATTTLQTHEAALGRPGSSDIEPRLRRSPCESQCGPPAP
jgi:hypothetical protein